MGGRGGRTCLIWVTWVLLAGCADRARSSPADGRLTATPSGVDFRRVALFDAHDVEVLARNVGRSPLTVTEAWIEGAQGSYQAEFVEPGPHTLAPGKGCTLKVRFAPEDVGGLAGVLVIRSDSQQAPLVRVPLQGTGVGAWAWVSPLLLDFGRIEVGSQKAVSFQLENPTDLPVEVTPKLIGADASEFSVQKVWLEPYEKRSVPLTFAPRIVGKKQVVMAVTPCRGCADVPVEIWAEGLERALVAEPPVLNFGAVPLDQEARLTSVVRNISTEPVTVQGFALDGADASYSHAAQGLPRVLAPNETYSVELRYSPGHMGPAYGRAIYRVASAQNPTTEVPLSGLGGAVEICVSPVSFDFGPVPVGSKISTWVNIKNCGAGNGGPLSIESVSFEPDPSGAPSVFHFVPLATPVSLAPGAGVNVKVFFEPTQAGAATATLLVRSSAYEGSTVRVPFFGLAEVHAPCNLVTTPAALDFGTIPPGAGAVLGIKVFNQGSDLCAVKNIHVSDSARGHFTLPGGALDGGILYPQDSFSFQVAFVSPAEGGDFTGAVQYEPADPAQPTRVIPLRASARNSCLAAQPPFVDFGVARPDCAPAPRTVNFLNQCAAPLDVSGVWIGAGTTDGEFVLNDSPPSGPFLLGPGQTFSVEVGYAAQVVGMNLSPLFVGTHELTHPLLVPLLGESSQQIEKTDRFIQQDGSKVDVLFVVDNTSTMVEEQPKLIAALPSFVSAALGKNVDLHVAVTTTGISPVSALCPGGAQGGEAGRLFPVDNSRPRVLTHQTPNLATRLQENADVGQCATVEQGFEAMRRALSSPLFDNADDPRTPAPNDGNLGFLRDEAALAVVFVGDEDDHSPDDVDTYVRFLREKKGAQQPQRATLFALAPTEAACASAGSSGTRYAEAALKTGGDVLSVCAPDYAPLLTAVANKTFAAQDRFPLSTLPDPTSLRVLVGGQQQLSGFTYDAASNSVVFTEIPLAGARIEVTYRRACP